MKKNQPRQLTRRQFTNFSISSFFGLMLSSASVVAAAPQVKQLVKRTFRGRHWLGTTFSQLQCSYLGLNYQETFRQICNLGIGRVRLCSYWNELEPSRNQFDFTKLDWLLDESDRCGIEVVLTVGMKAPRWPEFHFPDWLKAEQDTEDNSKPLDSHPAIADRTLQLVDRVVNHTRTARGLRYWQVENEPLTQLEITAGRFLSPEFVHQEVTLVRRLALPNQKILLTNAISLPSPLAEDDIAFQESLAVADAVGINVYTRVPDGDLGYLEPQEDYWKKLQDWQQALQQQGKEAWIAEAQAEPWEPNQLVAMDDIYYPSASPERMTELISMVRNLGYSPVLLWGSEYWHWHQKNGRSHWWQAIQSTIEA
ncbi:MAG: beta-galactosidase [Leptolyngbya sp. Prado105]|jgi:hypothetical protein|nr:beta-galactosidase [Leptolyngbya sp. Prado105]